MSESPKNDLENNLTDTDHEHPVNDKRRRFIAITLLVLFGLSVACFVGYSLLKRGPESQKPSDDSFAITPPPLDPSVTPLPVPNPKRLDEEDRKHLLEVHPFKDYGLHPLSPTPRTSTDQKLEQSDLKFDSQARIFSSVIRTVFHGQKADTPSKTLIDKATEELWKSSLKNGFTCNEWEKYKHVNGMGASVVNILTYLGIKAELISDSKLLSGQRKLAIFGAKQEQLKEIGTSVLESSKQGIQYRATAAAVPKDESLPGGAHYLFFRAVDGDAWSMFDDECGVYATDIPHAQLSNLKASTILYERV